MYLRSDASRLQAVIEIAAINFQELLRFTAQVFSQKAKKALKEHRIQKARQLFLHGLRRVSNSANYAQGLTACQ